MSNNSINFTINLNGNAYEGVLQLNDAISKVTSGIKDTNTFFERISTKAFHFDTITDAIGKLSDGFKFLAGDSLKFEQTQLNLQTLLGGSAEAADELVGKLREYGKNTVYDFNGLAEAQKTMMSFGIESDKAFSVLQNIGDIAMGDNQRMQSLALAFSQATSTGKLMGQDLMQMINAGFNPLQVISEKTGESMESLKKKMGDGAISSEMLAQAFQWATEEGGLFYEGAERAADSVGGRIAKMKDTVEEWKLSLFEATGGATAYIAEIGEMLVPIAQLSPLFSAVGGAIKWTTKQWNKFRNAVRKGTLNTVFDLSIINTAIVATGAFFKGLATVAKVACKSIGTAIKNIPIIGWIVAVVAAVVSVFKLLWEKSEGFRRLLFGVWEVVKAIVSHLWELLKGLITGIWESVRPFVDTLKGYVSSLWSSIVDGAVWLWEKAVEVATGIGDFFTGIWTWISTSAVSAFDWIVEKLGRVGTWITERLVKPIKQAFTGIWTVIKDVFNKIIDGLGKLFEPIRKLWNKLFPKDAFEKIGDAYRIGAEKGSESWRRDQKEKEEADGAFDIENGNINAGILQPDNVKKNGGSNPELSGGNLGSSAGVSAGKAQQVNITLESMVKTMNFNGSLSDNSRDVEQKLRELMARILGMAETAI